MANTPRTGDRILILKPHWMQLILRGDKTMEIRNRKLKSGLYFLGSKGKIYAEAELGEAIKIITSKQWRSLRLKHCVENNEFVYKNTYGIPLTRVIQFENTIPYSHKRGAIGIVKYR